jgi:hypothetical protein
MDEHGTVNGRLFRKDCLMIDKCAKSDRGQQLTKKCLFLTKVETRKTIKEVSTHLLFIYSFFLILFFLLMREQRRGCARIAAAYLNRNFIK